MCPVFINRTGMRDCGSSKHFKDVFGFTINQNEPDPGRMIEYIGDNKNFVPAHMDFDSGIFDPGDWTVENGAWFMDVKPCMLRYDGTVAYYLDPNDYDKKSDGTDSDVANGDFEGNAMVGFPKVYWKVEDHGNGIANVYFSDRKLDSGFVCWSHINCKGDEIPYCYMPCYNGCYPYTPNAFMNAKIRVLSKRNLQINKYLTDEVKCARMNNLTEDVIWDTEVFCDRMLVDLLLLLIGKSTDTVKVFGCGNYTTYGTSSNGYLITGLADQKGLFWGAKEDNRSQDNKLLKIFGMEHYWGNMMRYVGGWINDNGVQKIKMTYGTSDGSSAEGYDLDGIGYIIVPNGELEVERFTQANIKKCVFTPYGIIPVFEQGADKDTYYCSYIEINNDGLRHVYAGNWSRGYPNTGALGVLFNRLSKSTYWYYNTSLSCKPLVVA